MSLTILADENIPAVEHYLGALGTVRRVNGRALRNDDLPGVDVLLVRSVTRVDEALLRGSAVRFVGTATSGVDHIDTAYLSASGIGFAHAPGSNANSVVEYMLSAIAAVDDTLERLLAGASVGLVGYGIIGRAVAARLQALGISYKVYDPWLDQHSLANPASLAEVLSCAVVSLHPDLTLEKPWPSFHLLGPNELSGMGRHQLLINASRGAVVDNRALLALLREGRGPTAVLDVWEGEPAINHALLRQVNLGTPHVAGYSLDGKLLATRMLCEAMAAQLSVVLAGGQDNIADSSLIELPDGPDGADLIRHALGERYDIRRDHSLLRQATLGKSADPAAAAFDRLRRDYRERRELQGSTVRGKFHSPGRCELLLKLGCIPVSADTTA